MEGEGVELAQLNDSNDSVDNENDQLLKPDNEQPPGMWNSDLGVHFCYF